MEKNQLVSFKAINKLAIPAMISGLAEPLISLTDLAIIGSIPKNADLAIGAVGVSGSILSALIWIFAQTKSSISSYVSQALGEKKIEKISKIVPQILMIMTFFSVIVGIICWLSQDFIFQNIFHLSGESLEKANSYFSIRILGFPITIITFSLFGLFRGLQNTHWAMFISLIGGAVNIVLDFLFVKGIGLPEMGVEGAALASVLAQSLMMILALVFAKKKVGQSFVFSLKWVSDLPQLIKLTANYALRTLALNVALILANKYASSYGEYDIAVHTVLFNLWLFSAFLLDGYANAANAMSGKFLGAKDWISLKKLKNRIVLLSIIVSGVVGLVFYLGRQVLGDLFLDSDVAIQLFTSSIFLIVIIQPLNSIAFALDGVFKGMGEGKFLRNLLFIATGVIFIPIIILADFYWHNLSAVWLAFMGWMFVRSVIPWLYFNKKLKVLSDIN